MKIKEIPYQAVWPVRHQVMWSDMPINFVKLSNDDEGRHFGLFLGEKLVSIISVFIDQHQAQFRKFATIVGYQGKGLGSKLLSFLIDELKMQGITKIWCNARVNKTQFYKRFGLFITENTFSKKGVDFVVMELTIK